MVDTVLKEHTSLRTELMGRGKPCIKHGFLGSLWQCCRFHILSECISQNSVIPSQLLLLMKASELSLFPFFLNLREEEVLKLIVFLEYDKTLS